MFYLKRIKELNKKIKSLESNLDALRNEFIKFKNSDSYSYYLRLYNRKKEYSEKTALELLFDPKNKINKFNEITWHGTTVKYELKTEYHTLKVYYNIPNTSECIVEDYVAYFDDLKFPREFALKLYHIIDSKEMDNSNKTVLNSSGKIHIN